MRRSKRRAQLLATAREIVQKDGIGALTMSALAEQAGVSKPVVYDHFDNSEAVAIALLEDYYDTIIHEVVSKTGKAETLEDYLSIAIDTHFDLHTKEQLVVRKLTNGHSSDERVNAVFLDMKAKSIQTLQDLVMQQGVPAATAEPIGYILYEMMTNAVYEFAMDDKREEARTALKQMVLGAVHNVVARSVRKPETPINVLSRPKSYD